MGRCRPTLSLCPRVILQSKLQGKPEQYGKLDAAIRTAQFIRNKALRYWLDNQGINKNDLYKLCPDLAQEYEWAAKLNSQARQASIERAGLLSPGFMITAINKLAARKAIHSSRKILGQ
ncbi:hypothetical protein [Candidatus Cyanaurora vandensis]|uniref:hypothetical protein n=1 Tax=Candidatus Cyanaurora vandensis TaxID=2714958 RepID=UPI00257C68C0|nr:hypothetical protein [Candidatus Cyanaurora vandensis]